VHRETRNLPVYALVVARNGPKLAEGESDDPAGVRIPAAGQMTGVKATMSMLATALTKLLERKVIDETGLQGAYNFKLRFTPEQNPAKLPTDGATGADSVSLFEALPQQLGLGLKSSKGQ
jgi:uncharacterized protein (TIGR03435 family)